MSRHRRGDWYCLIIIFAFVHRTSGSDFPSWDLDEAETGQHEDAMGVWHDQLWFLKHNRQQLESFDGTTYRKAAVLPTGIHPWRATFTDNGMFVFAREPRFDGTTTLHLMRSSDGYQPFTDLFAKNINANQLEHSLADLGQGRLLWAYYGDHDSFVSYSDDNGDHWREVFRPAQDSIRHFHGVMYDPDYGKLYFMSGDSNAESSIMVTDDIYGPHGLLNDPQLWLDRWGMSDAQRSTMDTKYLILPDGVPASQRTRTVDMAIDGNYLYFGEDTGQAQRQAIFRIDRQTQAVEQVGPRDIIGAPWNFLRTEAGDLIFSSASIVWPDTIVPGHDEWVRIYALNDARTDYKEIARFPRKVPYYDTATSLSLVEAFGKIWFNGYEVPQDQKDIVGSLVRDPLLGDLDSNKLLNVNDVQILLDQMRANRFDVTYDVDHNLVFDINDLTTWIHDVKHTWIGDADLNGVFDSLDLVDVLSVGQFEDAIAGNSTWQTGDWDADGDFTTADLVAAMQDGGYDRPALSMVRAVPEPNSSVLTVVGAIASAAYSLSSSRRRPTPGTTV